MFVQASFLLFIIDEKVENQYRKSNFTNRIFFRIFFYFGEISMKVEVTRINGNYKLESKNDAGRTIIFDNAISAGGNEEDFRPMQSLLAALGACSSMDVISILKKQKLEPFGLRVVVDGERETGKDANLWKTIHAQFIFHGSLPREKAQRAVELSMKKYCSVTKTLEAAGAAVTFGVDVNP
jgi:putative redox protein